MELEKAEEEEESEWLKETRRKKRAFCQSTPAKCHIDPGYFQRQFFPTAMNLGARSRCVFRRRILDHSGTFTSMVFVWSWKVPSLSIYIGK